jgi:hypothetical protein
MTKHEIKIELNKPEDLKTVIEKSYFEEGQIGKIIGKKHFLKIDESDDINWTIFKGLHNATVKISNQEIIDGVMRFVVDEEEGDVKLYPISVYCIKEDKYIFY